MRIFVVKKGSDLQSLKAVAANPGMAEKLARVNPHIDVQKLAPGTVLLVPDDVAADDSPFGGGASIVGNALASFNEFAAQALDAAARGVKAGSQRQAADAETLKAALRSASLKEALARDPELAKQADAALKRAAEAAKAADGAAKRFEANTTAAREALAALAKKFG